jgi:hypothetical protein
MEASCRRYWAADLPERVEACEETDHSTTGDGRRWSSIEYSPAANARKHAPPQLSHTAAATKKTEKEEKDGKPQSKQPETDAARPLLAYTSPPADAETRRHANARSGARENDLQRDQRRAQPWELSAL